MNSGEVILGLALDWSCHGLEATKCFWIMYTLLEEIELRLADAHLTIHLEEALTSLIERIVADWFKL